jgi:ubiquinone/menaquinone biosynthesis C-methylase UbiE
MSDNAQQIEYWNGAVGERWARLQETIDANLSEITRSLLPFAAAKPGERVLEIGCGCGTTTLALAKAVAPNGAVTAVDISAPMLAVARARAVGLKIDFLEADASRQSFKPQFDLVFSRFGVMFFADPASAFANIRDGLAANGRMTFVCWRSAQENLWASVPFAAARDLVPPQEPADPLAPGPFAFADAARLRGILEKAGFANIRIETLDSTMNMGGSLDEAAAQALNIGPLARAAAGLDESQRDRIREAVKAALAKFADGASVAPPAACWLVSAGR